MRSPLTCVYFVKVFVERTSGERKPSSGKSALPVPQGSHHLVREPSPSVSIHTRRHVGDGFKLNTRIRNDHPSQVPVNFLCIWKLFGCSLSCTRGHGRKPSPTVALALTIGVSGLWSLCDRPYILRVKLFLCHRFTVFDCTALQSVPQRLTQGSIFVCPQPQDARLNTWFVKDL